MSQQQESQGSSSQFEDYEDQYPLSSPWQIQGKGRTHEGPKSEHPSTYDEFIPPLSYRAQDHGQTPSSPSSPRVGTGPEVGASPRVGASPTPTDKTPSASEASKITYRPYSQYTGGWQVPPGTRPQQNMSESAWPYVWLVIGILAFPMICYLLINVIIPLFMMIVMVVLGALLLAGVVIVILWIIGKIDHILPPSWW